MTRRLSTDEIQLNITINSNKAKLELGELDKRAMKLREEMKGLKKGTEEYAAKSRELAQVKSRMEELRKQVGLTGLSMRQLNDRARELRNIKQNLTPGTEEFKKVDAELTKVNARLKELRVGSGQAGRSLAQQAGQLRTSWAIIGASIYGAFRGLTRMMQAADQRLKANEELLFSMNREEAATKRLIVLAGELQRSTGVNDDTLKSQMAFLAIQGRSEDQIRRTITAAIDLAKVMGISVDQAVKMLDTTFEGNVGRLGRLDKAFTELTNAQLRNGEAIDLVTAKYGGIASATFEKGLGPLSKMQNAWTDLIKTVGEGFVNVFNPIFQRMASTYEFLERQIIRFSKTAIDRFDDQMAKVSELETQVKPLVDRYQELTEKASLNTTEQTELRGILDRVAQTMPSLVTQWDAHGNAVGLSTDRLKEHIRVQRLLLQSENEKALKKLDSELEKINRRYEAQLATRQEIAETGTFTYTSTAQGFEQRLQASDEMVQQFFENFAKVENQREVIMIKRDQLSGDFMQKELDRMQAERQNRQAGIQQKEDELQATRSIYKELSKAISDAKEKLAEYVAEGKTAEAQQQAAALKVLESQKAIIDKIIEANGSWEQFISTLRDDEFVKIMNRNEAALTDFLDVMGAAIDQDLNDLLDVYSAENDAQLESFQQVKIKNKEVLKAFKDNWTEFASIGANAAFDIYSNSLNAQTNAQLAALDKRRDAELKNENLTAQQREAIQEKYRKQEAKIKADAFKKQKTADIIMSIINTALAVTKALTSAPPPGNLVLAAISGAAGLAQTAVIASQPVPQFFRGRYDVTGATDNQLYRNVPFTGPARTGIYRGPALVAERGDELIIDNPTLRRVRVNYPEALRAIEASRVPQYAAGRYNSADAAIPDKSESSEILALVIATIHSNSEAINKLIHKLDKDIIAKLNYQDIRSMDAKVDDIESSTRI